MAALQLRDDPAPARAFGERVVRMILFKLLALPITAPAAGIRYCIDKVVEFAEHELTDDGPVREQLLELQLDLEEGRVTEEEYTERETVLLARLREVREYRKQLAREAAEASAPAVGEERTVVIEVPEELE
ncbi:MAG: hypothetical protein E6H89_02395 [Chloroflexi bacterium]|nr:MAG: hypothetical protein E6H89_02395 [Chloroflexota bacterium]